MNMILHPLARILVASIFIISGLGKIFGFAPTAEMMGNVGFPAPEFFLIGAIAFELFGGLSLILGFQTRIGAGLLIIFVILATLIFHAPFITDAARGQAEIVQTLKNLAILGALVKFWIDGAGAFALDNLSVVNFTKHAEA
ncbi:MAG TPA: DoxX family protein [Pyrinomonadaceae bacterium]|nr:DoxX family protein [Pyrinomonadaceae bacterium]